MWNEWYNLASSLSPSVQKCRLLRSMHLHEGKHSVLWVLIHGLCAKKEKCLDSSCEKKGCWWLTVDVVTLTFIYVLLAHLVFCTRDVYIIKSPSNTIAVCSNDATSTNYAVNTACCITGIAHRRSKGWIRAKQKRLFASSVFLTVRSLLRHAYLPSPPMCSFM